MAGGPCTFLISYSFNSEGFLWGQLPHFMTHHKMCSFWKFPISPFCGNGKKQGQGQLLSWRLVCLIPLLYLHFCWQELRFPGYKRWPGVTSAQGAKGCCTSWRGAGLSSRQEEANPRASVYFSASARVPENSSRTVKEAFWASLKDS